VQGAVSALNLAEFPPREQLHVADTSWLWIPKLGPKVFWDDSESLVAADHGPCYISIVQTHLIPGDALPDLCGLVLQPTGLERGQFRRLGVVLHQNMWSVTNFDAFLQTTKDPKRLGEDFYQEPDPYLGFTIDII
jgi:hypothetical protein